MALVTLDDVHAALNYPSGTTVDDAELQGFIDAATVEIEKLAGKVESASFTEVYDGGDVSIYLRQRPVLSVQSITEVIGSLTYTLSLQPPGQSVDAWGYSLDNPMSGKVVRRSAAGQPWRFTPGIGNITVIYTAGRADVPANIRLATLELIEHWWQHSQQGAFATPTGGAIGSPQYDDAITIPGQAFGIPYRVQDKLTQERMPVIA